MGRYASGTPIKTVIRTEVRHVKAVLADSGLSKEAQKGIIDAFKEMAYQWCSSNAMACAMEAAAKEMMTEEEYRDLCKKACESGVQEQKMKDTYPY